MTLHSDAVRVLQHVDSPLRDRYLAHLAAHENGVYRECSPDHLTASILVLSHDHTQVLLTLHAKAQQWFQFGGHCEPGDTTLLGAAMREGLEESGLDSLDVHPVPVHLDAHRVEFCNGGATHLDVRFVGVAPEGADHAASEESLEVRWWPVDGLPTDEPSILDLVRAGVHVVAADSQV